MITTKRIWKTYSSMDASWKYLSILVEGCCSFLESSGSLNIGAKKESFRSSLLMIEKLTTWSTISCTKSTLAGTTRPEKSGMAMRIYNVLNVFHNYDITPSSSKFSKNEMTNPVVSESLIAYVASCILSWSPSLFNCLGISWVMITYSSSSSIVVKTRLLFCWDSKNWEALMK